MEKEIYLAGGCFWGVEGYFAQLDGVITTKVGYSNGQTAETTYQQIKTTDHAEVIYLKYDNSVLPLNNVLRHYFRIIDPVSINKQGGDRGRQYRTGIYYVDEETREEVVKFIEELQKNYTKKVWRLPIFPRRYLSILGVNRLNCRVRNVTGCIPAASITKL